MTRSELTRITKEWQRRLKLEHWKLKLDWDSTPDQAGSLAEIGFNEDYDDATICFATTYKKWEEREANEIVVHELLHLHERGIVVGVRSLDSLLGKPAYTVFSDRMNHEREGLVDRLSIILVDLAGAA